MVKCDKCGEFIEFVRLCPLCARYEKERLKRSAKKREERADKYEALTQELVDVLDVVLSEDPIPMSEWLESKGQLKKIHSKAKKVLGDG